MVRRKSGLRSAMFDYGKSGLKGSRLRRNSASPASACISDRPGARSRGLPRRELLPCGKWRVAVWLSARGLAVDCGMDRAEEFPMFTAFWLERPALDAGTLTVYASWIHQASLGLTGSTSLRPPR